MSASDERHRANGEAQLRERGGEVGHLALDGEDLALHVQAHVDRDLVVAGAAGVDLLAEVAEALGEHALDGHVDVLVVLADGELARFGKLHHLGELAPHLGGLGLGHHRTAQALHFAEHRHVRGGAHAVPLRELEVEHRILAHGVGEHVGVDRPVGDGTLRAASSGIGLVLVSFHFAAFSPEKFYVLYQNSRFAVSRFLGF